MSAEDLLRSLKDLMQQTAPEDRLSAFRGFKHGRTAEERTILDAGFDLYVEGLSLDMQAPSSVPSATHSIVVALIHGIRTTGNWQEKARAVLLKEKGVTVVPIGYGYFDLLRFLGPARKQPIERVKSELRDLQRMHPGADLIVMAHSFGTYIVSKLLQDAPDIRIARLLLCGSIIPLTYRWDQLPHHFTQKTLINEVGTNDYWPVFARVASFGYGGSGSFGFKTARVWDRFFAYGHSDFFTEKHFEDFWKPFILHGEVVTSPWDNQRPTPPWWISFLGSIPMVKIVLGILVLLLVAACHWAVLGIGLAWNWAVR